mgnify:CR=1 FL=1
MAGSAAKEAVDPTLIKHGTGKAKDLFGRREAMQTVTDTVIGEIGRSLDFYGATSAESRIEKVYLAGGSALGVTTRPIVNSCR